MGYELHITRRSNWSEPSGPEIAVREWVAYVRNDPELEMDETLGEHLAVWSGQSQHEIPWLAWNNGNIESKNPDVSLIKKMVQVAAVFAAQVQGDDLEVYGPDGCPEEVPKHSWLQRVWRRWSNILARSQPQVTASELPFKVGDRVQDDFGRFEGTVVEINLRAEQGMGRITVRYDDGRQISSAAIAHGFKPVL